MPEPARILGGASIIATPLLLAGADQLRMAAEGVTTLGESLDFGVMESAAQLAAIDANRGLFELASWLAYAGALTTIPALVTMWWLAVRGSRRWAWAGAVFATLGVVGQTVHLAGYFAPLQVLSGRAHTAETAEIALVLSTGAFNTALFVPFFFAYLAWVPQVVALRRARVVGRWSVMAVCAGTAVFAAAGSQPWSTTVWAVSLTAGLLPAAATMSHRLQPAEVSPRRPAMA